MNVWDLFEATASRFADRPAVEVQRRGGLESRSYAHLRAMAIDHAARLHALGVGPGDRCAILADNDAEWCAAYLGILRLGALAIPLDTNYSADQVRAILRDSGARLLFVNERLRAVASEAAAHVPNVVLTPLTAAVGGVESAASYGEGGTVAHGPQALQPCPATEGSWAVILYTSGTTADPKGVVLSHGNLLAERDATFQAVPVSERDSVLSVLPLFHALAQLANLLLPVAVGARVVFLETLNSTELLRALAERRITVFACVPQFFYLIHARIMQEGQRSGVIKHAVFRALLRASFGLRGVGVNLGPLLFRRVHALLGRDVRLFIVGGSKFDPVIGRDLYALGFTILQAYGLTETSGAATITRPNEAHLDTVGRPLPGQDVRVLAPDPSSQALSSDDNPELDGEIAVRGPIVMQGYYNRPEATAATIRDGWFLTGDIGRMDRQGRLTITGRKKDVIVLASGKNIYPEEVEAAYRKSPYIKELCVLGLARDGEPTTERLYAVVVPDLDLLRTRRMVNAGDIIRFEMEGLSISLPPHKRVLGYEVWFEPLPRTTTGKVKRHEIRQRVRQRRRDAVVDAAVLPPADRAWLEDNHVAEALAIVRRRVHGLSAISPAANLELDLGLDSMERVELLTDLQLRFGVRVPEERTHELFTVRQVVEAVRPALSEAADLSRVEGPASSEGQRVDASEQSWTVLLRDLPPDSDPALSGVLRRRPIMAPLLFLLSRLVRLLLARTRATGLEHLPADGPYIVSPNHQSYLDPFFVCGVLPYRTFRNLFFVGAAEYFETPFMRWVARLCNCVPVDPDAHLVPAMKAGAFGLKHGKILMLFPEGERSIDGTVKRFKKGSPILSQHLHVPIVPVAIDGAFEIWPRNRPFNWRVLAPWSRHRVRLAFGRPLAFDDTRGYAEAADELRGSVATMWKTLRA